MTPEQAELALAFAALNPDAAIEAVPFVEEAHLEGPPPAVAGVPVPVQRAAAITFAVECEPPQPISRWRYFIFYCLIKLASKVYPFKFELYRSSQPWED